jgi:hypothetical protein
MDFVPVTESASAIAANLIEALVWGDTREGAVKRNASVGPLYSDRAL